MTSAAKLLTNRKLRVTVARLAVLELLQTHARLSPVDVFRLLDRAGTRVSLATIHRSLAELREAGLIERHFLGDGKASYAQRHSAATVHLVCRDCGAIASIDDAALDRRVKHLATRDRFMLAEWSVSLHGRCADCTAAAESAPRRTRRTTTA